MAWGRAVDSDAAVHEHQMCPMSGQQAHAPAGTSRKRRGEPCPSGTCLRIYARHWGYLHEVAWIALRANLDVVDGRILHAESEPYARSVKTSMGVLHISHMSVELSGPQEQREGVKLTSEVSWTLETVPGRVVPECSRA